MRKVLAVALGATMALGAASAVAGPGPNGRNNHGLCTAYFAGSENGRAHKRNAPPFQALERAAGVESDDTIEERDSKVREFCSTATPGGKGEAPGERGNGETAGARGNGKKK